MPVLKNKKHEAVVQAWLRSPDKVGWKAYAEVYPRASQRTAEVAWSQLIRKPEVSARLTELQQQIAEETKISVAKTLDELGRIGFSNMSNFTRIHGSQLIIDFSQMTREQASAIKKVKVVTKREMKGEGDDAEEIEVVTTEIELHPKLQALELLGKHLKLFTDRLQLDVSNGLADRLDAMIRQADQPGK